MKAARSRTTVWYVAITDYPRGLGSTARARSICQALRRAGRNVHLVIPYAIGHAPNEKVSGVDEGIAFEYLNQSTTRPRGPWRVVLAKLLGSIRLARRLQRDRRHMGSVFICGLSWIDAWPMLLTARVNRIPIIVDFTDEWHDPAVPVSSLGWFRYCYQRLARFAEGIVFRNAAAIMVVSRHMERRVARFADRVTRLPMVFDPGRFEGAEAEALDPAGEAIILYAGSLSTTEGTDVLLRAFAALRRSSDVRVHLWLLGNTAHREAVDEYQELAHELGIDTAVTFRPPVDRARYPRVLRGATILVIPRPTTVASQAGFPYKLGEYLASGVPVVTTRFGDVEEYFVGGRHCFMADPDSVSDLTKQLERALQHPSEARAMAAAGQRRVREVFGVESVARSFDRLLAEAEQRVSSRPVRACAP